MPRIGRRDQLVTLERFGFSRNQYDEEVEDWAEIGKEYAAVYYGRGDERRRAAADEAAQTATFGMPANPVTRSLKPKDRIQHGGVWDIQGVSPDTPKPGDIEITATRSA